MRALDSQTAHQLLRADFPGSILFCLNSCTDLSERAPEKYSGVFIFMFLWLNQNCLSGKRE